MKATIGALLAGASLCLSGAAFAQPPAAHPTGVWVRRDCNVDGSNCRFVARYRTRVQCQRAQALANAEMPLRRATCTLE